MSTTPPRSGTTVADISVDPRSALPADLIEAAADTSWD